MSKRKRAPNVREQLDQLPKTNAIGGQPVGLQNISDPPRPRPDIAPVDKAAIRAALKESRKRHTVKVRSHLQ